MKKIKEKTLFDTDPFCFSQKNLDRFVDSYRENALHHYYNSSLIKSFWDDAGVHPSQIKSEADLKLTPPIMVHLFKENNFKSVPDSEIVLSLTSSGTSGVKSKQYLNSESLSNVKKLAYKIHESLGMTSEKEYQYLCFTYDPKIANDLGTAFTDELLTQFTGKTEVYYAIQWCSEKNNFEFNAEGTVQTLKRFAANGKPTRILGFPAFLVQIIRDYHITLDLGKDSWIQTGGGWKTDVDHEIPKSDFRLLMNERLGVPLHHIRDLFGMVEHGIPYVDCEKGELHISNYSRVYIRSPFDLSFLPEDSVGLIQFLCTYNTSYPALNILTTDYGSISNCSCELGKQGSKILKLHGRAGQKLHQGCAIKALELLQKTGVA